MQVGVEEEVSETVELHLKKDGNTFWLLNKDCRQKEFFYTNSRHFLDFFDETFFYI